MTPAPPAPTPAATTPPTDAAPPPHSASPIRARRDVAARSATRPAPAGHTVTTIHTRPIRHRAPAADTSNIGSGRREPDSGAKSLATDRSVIAPPRTA